MLKMMVFSIDTKVYFELGMSELHNFLDFLKKEYKWDNNTFNIIDEKLKNILAKYEPQFYKKDWCEKFKNWLSSLGIGDSLCLYDGWVTEWDKMEKIKQKYIEHFLNIKDEKQE